MSFTSKISPLFSSNKKSLIIAVGAILFLGGASSLTYALTSSSTQNKTISAPQRPTSSLLNSSTPHASTSTSIPPSTTTTTVLKAVSTPTSSVSNTTPAISPVATASRASSPKTSTPSASSSKPTTPPSVPPVTAPPVTVPPVTVPPTTTPVTTPPPSLTPTGVAWYAVQSCSSATCNMSVMYNLSDGTVSQAYTETWTEFFSGSIVVTSDPASGFALPYPLTLTYDGSTNTITWSYPSGDPPAQP